MFVRSFGTYSIHFYPGDGSMTYALDWGPWRRQGHEWTVSCRETSARWSSYVMDPLMAHHVLLDHFGLLEWEDEFPYGRIRFMAPRQLAGERRKKENEHKINDILEMRSNTIGYHVLAESHPQPLLC